MFSSLNVIAEADYTFYTAFQDHQYKVTTHHAWSLVPAVHDAKAHWVNITHSEMTKRMI